MFSELKELIGLKVKCGKILDKYDKEDIENLTKTAAGTSKIIAEANSIEDEDERDKVKADTIIEYCKNIQKAEEKKQKNYAKMHKQVFKIAKLKAASYSESEVDSALFNKIMKLMSISDRYSYYNKACKTQDLINYTIWRLTDVAATKLTTITRDEKMLCNGISQELHGDPLYPDVGALDIKLFDPFISGWKDQRYLLNLEVIKNLVSVNFQDQIVKAMNPFAGTTGSTSGLRTPIRFKVASPNPGNTLVDPEKEVDPYNLNLLNEALSNYYTEERQYKFELGTAPNTYKLIALNPLNGIWEEFMLNIGFYGKDVVSILCQNMFGQTICLHPSCETLWQKVLGNCFYKLTDVETNEAARAVSQYFWIYNTIDMSTIPETEILNGFDAKLNAIFTDLQFNNIAVSNLYKFEKYNGVNDFIMNGVDGSVIISNDVETCYRLGSTFRKITI